MAMTDDQKIVSCDTAVKSDGGLQRNLKERHVQLIALGGIIGSCFFLGTGQVVSSVGPAAFLCYLLGGIIVYLVMMSLSELAATIPIAGSFVNYASDFISPAWACGVGWTYWLGWVSYIPGECIAAGIIVSSFFPALDPYIVAVIWGAMITLINISNVKAFGEAQFWLASIVILGLLFFCIMAILIIFGVVHGEMPAHFVGTTNLFDQGGLFPMGGFAMLTVMVMLLVNFQGTEIVGLSAGECADPAKTIPKVVRNVAYRIVGLYLVPVFLLVCILPWNEAGLAESVFATALNKYGVGWAGTLFSVIALTASSSCANGGTYGTVRSLWALAREGMAPSFLGKLNKNSVPANATIVTMGAVWLFIAASYFFKASDAFVYLLAISGFTGTMCWLSICWSQYNFRNRLYAAGYTTADLKYVAPFFPYGPLLAIALMVASLIFCLYDPDLRVAFYFGVPALIIPVVLYMLFGNKTKKVDEAGRIGFDELFPVKNASNYKSSVNM